MVHLGKGKGLGVIIMTGVLRLAFDGYESLLGMLCWSLMSLDAMLRMQGL
jgi:hypothetical protein